MCRFACIRLRIFYTGFDTIAKDIITKMSKCAWERSRHFHEEMRKKTTSLRERRIFGTIHTDIEKSEDDLSMETIRILNLAISLTGVVLCSIGILHMLLSKKIHERTVEYMLPTYICLIVFAASNLAGQLMRGQPGDLNRTGLYFSNFLEFLSPALATYIMSQYLLAIVDPQKKWKAVRAVLLVPVLIHTALLIVSQFTGFYYIIDSENFYQRSAWFPLSQALIAVLLVTDIVLLFRDKAVLTQKEAVAFSIYFMIPLLTAVIQVFVYGVYLNILATIVAALAMYVFIFSEQTERYYRQIEENARQKEENARQKEENARQKEENARQKEENARQKEENAQLKLDVMLSQINPHFLYNTLGGIETLCEGAPIAKEAIHTFAFFLHGNFDTLTERGMISFERELNHTKLFLDLEKMRFGDELTIVYDITCTDFDIPTLTLQPIVENAVTHGVRMTEWGQGTVTIKTREYDDRVEVSVLDDGPGFDPETPPNDGRRHIGIANVRQRLQSTCGGSLRIESGNNGTCATIILPKGEMRDAYLCD